MKRSHMPNSRHFIQAFSAKARSRRRLSEKVADWIAAHSGTMTFLVLNAVFFASWIVVNLGWIADIEPFDPYPFGFLTMVVSLEAIILSVVVLISQNRGDRIETAREELTLQIDLMTERELTKVLHVLSQIAEKQGIDLSKDHELKHMLKPTNVQKIESEIEDQV